MLSSELTASIVRSESRPPSNNRSAYAYILLAYDVIVNDVERIEIWINPGAIMVEGSKSLKSPIRFRFEKRASTDWQVFSINC